MGQMNEIANKLAGEFGLTKKVANAFTKALVKEMATTILTKKKLRINEFGIFTIMPTAAREMNTGIVKQKVPASFRLKFVTSQSLKAQVKKG